MNKLTELTEAAKAVLATESRCPYANQERYDPLANPATILELCTLLQQAEEALKGVWLNQGRSDPYRNSLITPAIFAIKKWKKQT